jgi:hypothetical protein
MVGERDREQDAVRWELDDTAAISIPPPFNNGVLQYNHLQQQQYAAMAAAAAAEDMPGRWDDESNYGLMGGGDSMVGGANTTDKGVRFPDTSPTHGFSNGQLSQAPLQSTHSRYRDLIFDQKKQFFGFSYEEERREEFFRCYTKAISS